ncbi:hypothetical protein PVL29_007792 [Vitis rotundifolia]|uniref:Uncharacterized protein n=1 Tax=Vitis rotundifolia TaxID=103349 RepID=A0AA39DXA2_VITRO|nr:hypothetical protein PVL29_007792 [Vitis rotundifolia]
MGDLTTLAKARRELEELYLGVPDESVNLTFQDLAEVTKNAVPPPEKRKAISMESTPEGKSKREGPSPLNKIPSLDFNRGLQASKSSPPPPHQHSPYHHHHVNKDRTDSHRAPSHHHHLDGEGMGHHYADGENFSSHASPNGSRKHSGYRHAVESSMAYDDRSHVSMASIISPFSERGGRRRPGIPHSNICTICNTYIYIFRHRCLVCGRVYCRSCLSMGMGEMTEGRKCIACLGKRFSQRYIKRAGDMGCCAGYPSMAKQQELSWAEKGPRRSSERGRNRSMMMSRSRSPVTPRTPTRSHHQTSNTPSFVMNSPYSPYSPSHHHPIPF